MDDNKKFWDRTAKLYAPIQERSNQALYRETARCCGRYLSADTRVLEIGCGSGQMTELLCGMTASWEATDFSENMVREAEKRSSGKARYSVQNATALPWPEGSFDVVLMANVLHIVPEPGKILTECLRVLVSGGILLTPTFVYEGKVNRLRMCLTEMVGFKTFHKWDSSQLVEFVEKTGFSCVERKLLPGDPLPEMFAAFRKA